MTKKNVTTFRSTLGRVRGLGSAKSGTHEWYMMRLTALAIVLLASCPVFGLFAYAAHDGREGALHWLKSPFAATGIILFLIVGFHHAAAGLQVIIEDYVHCKCAKSAALFFVKSFFALFAVLGIVATLKIALGV